MGSIVGKPEFDLVVPLWSFGCEAACWLVFGCKVEVADLEIWRLDIGDCRCVVDSILDCTFQSVS